MKDFLEREIIFKKKQEKFLTKGKYIKFLCNSIRWIAELNKNELEDKVYKAFQDLLTFCEFHHDLTLPNKLFKQLFIGINNLGEYKEALEIIWDFIQSYYSTRKELIGSEEIIYQNSCLLSGMGEKFVKGSDFYFFKIKRSIQEYYQIVERFFVSKTHIYIIGSPASTNFASRGKFLSDQDLFVDWILPELLTMKIQKDDVISIEFRQVKIRDLETVRFYVGEERLDILVEDKIRYPGMDFITPPPYEGFEEPLIFKGLGISPLDIKRGLQSDLNNYLKTAGWYK